MSSPSFETALWQVGDPPCDAYSCPKRLQCGREKLACYAFFHWIGSRGRPTSPWVSKVGHQVVTDPEPVATRDMYERCFPAVDRDPPLMTAEEKRNVRIVQAKRREKRREISRQLQKRASVQHE